jgi:plasmid stabilization system protein ParE
VRQHIIYYYQSQPAEIMVLRILHARQDADTAVVRPPS